MRFVLTIMDQTNMLGAKSGRIISEGIDLAGVIGDRRFWRFWRESEGVKAT